MCGAENIVHAVDEICGPYVAVCYMEKLKMIQSAVWNVAAMKELVHEMRAQMPEQIYVLIQLQKLKTRELKEFQKSPYTCLSYQFRCFL